MMMMMMSSEGVSGLSAAIPMCPPSTAGPRWWGSASAYPVRFGTPTGLRGLPDGSVSADAVIRGREAWRR